MKSCLSIVLLLSVLFVKTNADRNKRQNCEPSVTTASGPKAPGQICKGALIFEDNFDNFDDGKWTHENTFFGFGNGEFQWYTDDSQNSFSKDGNLLIRPSLTSDFLGSEDKLYSETITINQCTVDTDNGCQRTGTPENVLNPVRSARLHTRNSFQFKYGRVEMRAQMPIGDWLWPAMWLFPGGERYGGWPRSGEIDLVESRGNEHLQVNGGNIGVGSGGATLHWAPDPQHNAWQKTHYEWNKNNNNWRTYGVDWTPDYIKFSVDGETVGTADPGSNFWDFGQFAQQGLTDNPWAGASKMAPFDQEFFFILNLAVGGTNGYFPDEATNSPYPKPWKNNAAYPRTDFWKAKDQWLPTWKLGDNDGYDASLKVDYVRVWAL